MVAGEGAAGGRLDSGPFRAGLGGASPVSVLADRMALVSGDAAPGDWLGAGGRTGDGGSLYLSSLTWGADPGGLGSVRTDPRLAVSRDCIVGGGWHGDRLVPGIDAASDWLLERRR